MKNVAIYGKYFESENAIFINELVEKLHAEGCLIYIIDTFFNITNDYFDKSKVVVICNNEFTKYPIDFLLSIGGDGSLLDTLSLIKDSEIPVTGINMGTLGFLSSISKHQISNAIEAILNGNYTLDCRTLLSLEDKSSYFGNLNYAMNEFCIKTNSNTMLNIHVCVDNIALATYRCDGLIIATPTGSTAYSLSCGGPIIAPQTPSFVITPIASHNLTSRPVVISDNSIIELSVTSRNTDALLCLDSRIVKVSTPLKLRIKKESFNVKLINLSSSSFFSAIREKLGWGNDIRN